MVMVAKSRPMLHRLKMLMLGIWLVCNRIPCSFIHTLHLCVICVYSVRFVGRIILQLIQYHRSTT